MMSTIAIIAERRHLENASLQDARTVFEQAGHDVEFVVPGAERLFDIPDEPPDWAAALSRGRDLTGLALLSAVSALGVLAFNAPHAIELVRNKIAMQAVLHQHHLPMPASWFAADASAFATVAAARFPLVVKPFDGDGARGLWLLRRPQDALHLPPMRADRSIYLAQQLLDTDGWDLKLYGIGSDVWAVRKPSPVEFGEAGPATTRPAMAEAEVVDLDAWLRDIALTCGRACGLDLWGVDVALTPAGPFIIEVNDFPTYSAVPGAGACIAGHVLARVEMDAIVHAAGRNRTASVVRQPR